MAKQDAKRITDEATRLLDEFHRVGAQLQKKWTPENWLAVNSSFESFCIVSQRMNMCIGGMQVRVFDEAIRILGKFIEYAEDLMQEASQRDSLPADDVLNNILGVIDRCKLRIPELEEKRDDIGILRDKIEDITDP